MIDWASSFDIWIREGPLMSTLAVLRQEASLNGPYGTDQSKRPPMLGIETMKSGIGSVANGLCPRHEC